MRRQPRYPEGVKVRNTLKTGSGVECFAWSSAGDRLATTHNDRCVRIWSAQDGELLVTIDLQHAVSYYGRSPRQVVWSPDDRTIAVTCSPDEEVLLFEAASGQRDKRTLIGHDGEVTCTAWSPDGNYLATGSDDQFIGIWSCGAGELKASLEGHTGAITSVAWHPEQNLLASAGRDNTARLWNTDSETLIWTYQSPDASICLDGLGWLPRAGQVVTGWQDGSLRLLDATSGRVAGLLDWDHQPESVSLSSDGVFLAVASHSVPHPALLSLWFCNNWQYIETMEDVEIEGYAPPCVRFHPKHHTLATLVGYDEIRILELDAEKLGLAPPRQANSLRKADESALRPPSDIEPGRSAVISPASFDVFCCYNSADKAEVKRIAQELKTRDLVPWLDEWHLRPGLPWQDAVQKQIQTIRSVAVFIGKRGFGPWQSLEMKAFLEEFTKRGCPVIPVLLPDFDGVMPLPPFLAGMTWVDFRRSEPNPIDQLTFGITGSR
jgi:WD40 repeat protein